MKKLTGVTLGILTAIGAFVDLGDLVANAVIGARFGWSLVWVLVLGVVGISIFAEMSGRVAAITGSATFDLVRERLGPRLALGNLLASFAVTFFTLIAQVAGVALALELVTGVRYVFFLPLTGLAVWLVIWQVRFQRMEQVFGLLGLVLVVFAVAAWKLGPDWSQLWQETTRPTVPKGEGVPTYWYYAIALFGAALTPYEVFFYSSGAVQERWTRDDLKTNRITVLVGFPLGGLLSLSIMTTAAIVFRPTGFMVSELAHVAFPVFLALGKVGLAVVIIGFFIATFGASLETALSSGYMVAQYFGWPWGNDRPLAAARFHTLVSIRSLSSPSLWPSRLG